MEYKLVFNLTLFDGTTVDQSFDVPPDPAKVQAAINQLIAMYMSMGYIKSSPDGLTAHRVNQVSVAVPSILIANQLPTTGVGSGKISLT